MWRFSTRKGRIRAPRPARRNPKPERYRDVVVEAELFLSGRYAEHLLARGEPVPDWAWLNMLAHSPAAVIERLAVSEDRRRAHWCHKHVDPDHVDEVIGWQNTVHFLAREVAERAHTGARGIEDIQRDALVTLEMDLARAADLAGAPGTGTMRPTQLTVTVLSMLDNPTNHRI